MLDLVWTIISFLLSWLLWLLWKIVTGIFWGIFGIPLLVILIIAGVLWWRVGYVQTLRRLTVLRHAVVPTFRAFAISIITLVSVLTGASILEKLPERIRKVLVGGAVSAPGSVPTRIETKVVKETVYSCGPIARLFNVFVILYGIMQFTIASFIVLATAGLFI